jgi:glycolate oxidase FAD binding subunit
MVLGLECVTGRAELVTFGGRVVKNVAGFDLVRLFTGSWGTLGAITRVTLRLRAMPEADVTLALPILDSPEAMHELQKWLRALPFSPYALEVLDGALAESLGIALGGAVMLVRLGGRASAVTAQRDTLSKLGRTHAFDTAIWNTLRASEPAGAAVVRLSDSPSHFADVWRGAKSVVDRWPGALLQGSPSRGLARVVLPRAPGGYDALRAAFQRANGTRVFERLPARLWPVLAPTRTAQRLSAGIREAFDPKHIMNPGILGEPA